MKLRKLKKAQAKASRDARPWTGGVPVMDVRASSVPTTTRTITETPDPGHEAGQPDMDEDATAASTAVAMAAGEPQEPAEAVEAERIALAETMYRAAQARFEAAEALELAAAQRLSEAEAAERAAAERLAAAERGEHAASGRLAAVEDRERAAAERLAAADARERAAAERISAADIREQAIAGRLAAADARERAAAERDVIANQRDRTAAERDALANERDRASLERPSRPVERANPAPAGVSGEHELEIARLKAELERAHLDSLTGALRREIGRLTLHNEIERARRSDGQFVLAFVDVDDLKGINDREGHAAGDRVLRTLAATLRANLRTYDPVVRYGGDEFVCGVTGVSVGELEHRMTLIDQSLRRATGVGISAGMATLREGETLDEITARADEALLEAKRSRDR